MKSSWGQGQIPTHRQPCHRRNAASPALGLAQQTLPIVTSRPHAATHSECARTCVAYHPDTPGCPPYSTPPRHQSPAPEQTLPAEHPLHGPRKPCSPQPLASKPTPNSSNHTRNSALATPPRTSTPAPHER